MEREVFVRGATASKYSGEVGDETHVFDISLAFDGLLSDCLQVALHLP